MTCGVKEALGNTGVHKLVAGEHHRDSPTLLSFSFQLRRTGGAYYVGSMIYRSGGGAHIVFGCGSFDNTPYLYLIEGFDQYIVATLLQDIDPEIVVTQA